MFELALLLNDEGRRCFLWGVGQPIFDPLTTRQNPDGTWSRDPFPTSVVLYIDPTDEDKALDTLRKHKFWGPRYNEGHELYIDFEDPDGHLLEFWRRKQF